VSNKKLLFVVNIPEFFLSHRLSLALLAKEKGYQVHVATAYSDSFEKIESYGFHCHRISLKRGSLNVFYELAALISIYRVLRFVKPDVTHLLTAKCNIYGGLALKLLKAPRIIHAITGLGYIFVESNNILRIFLKKIIIFLFRSSIKRSSIVIFQNKENLDLFIKQKIINNHQARLIYGSGVNTDIFYYSEDKIIDNPIVLFPSRLIKEKGVITFVEAAKILKDKKNLRMIVAGSLDYENPSSIQKEQIDEWVKLGIIEWSGYVKDMPNLLSQSSVVCLPSYYPEGVPKALIEAASCGRAIITSDMPGCNEIVENYKNGLLIPIRSPEKLADAIIKLIDDINLRIEYGKNGRNLVIEKFSSEIVDNATLKTYSS
jgi:glycosyltransferase involved in cell wall biosynthesis